MVPDSYRLDGWPLCPVCGEDELADLSAVTLASLSRDLHCHCCQRVTVRAGEAKDLGSAVESYC